MTGSNEEGEQQPLPKLQDGRDFGQWRSVYSWRALIWIYIELLYLLLLLLLALLTIGVCAVAQMRTDEAAMAQAWLPTWLPVGLIPSIYFWPAVLAAGVTGGTAAALKWHYHCVAKKLWHADRRVWRITAPLLSGVLALFVVMLIRSEIISILSADVLTKFPSAISLAFLLGLVSDNLLAALQNLANAAFGTLKDTKSRSDQPPDETT